MPLASTAAHLRHVHGRSGRDGRRRVRRPRRGRGHRRPPAPRRERPAHPLPPRPLAGRAHRLPAGRLASLGARSRLVDRAGPRALPPALRPRLPAFAAARHRVPLRGRGLRRASDRPGRRGHPGGRRRCDPHRQRRRDLECRLLRRRRAGPRHPRRRGRAPSPRSGTAAAGSRSPFSRNRREAPREPGRRARPGSRRTSLGRRSPRRR